MIISVRVMTMKAEKCMPPNVYVYENLFNMHEKMHSYPVNVNLK